MKRRRRRFAREAARRHRWAHRQRCEHPDRARHGQRRDRSGAGQVCASRSIAATRAAQSRSSRPIVGTLCTARPWARSAATSWVCQCSATWSRKPGTTRTVASLKPSSKFIGMSCVCRSKAATACRGRIDGQRLGSDGRHQPPIAEGGNRSPQAPFALRYRSALTIERVQANWLAPVRPEPVEGLYAARTRSC